MPRGDGRGPAGYGPMTGRGAGFCAGYSVPGYMNPIGRRGFGGRGRGRGFGFYGGGRGYGRGFYEAGMPLWAREPYPYGPQAGYYEEYSRESEADALSQEAKFLKQELKAIEERMEMLEKAEKNNPAD